MQAHPGHDGAYDGEGGGKPPVRSQRQADGAQECGQPGEQTPPGSFGPSVASSSFGGLHPGKLPCPLRPAKGQVSGQASPLGLGASKVDLRLLLLLGLCVCCSPRGRMPDPRDAARQYEQAVSQKDAAALHALLSREARSTYSLKDVAELLERDQADLSSRASACAEPAAELRATAVVASPSGLELGLALEDGLFRIDSDSALFPRPQTPEAAVRALVWALKSGETERVEAVLSAERRAGLEERRAALLESLSGLDRASVQVRDHRAVVELPDGQEIELVEEQGVWRVEAVP